MQGIFLFLHDFTPIKRCWVESGAFHASLWLIFFCMII